MLLPKTAWVLVESHVAVSIVGAAVWCAASAALVALLPRDWEPMSAGDTITTATASRALHMDSPRIRRPGRGLVLPWRRQGAHGATGADGVHMVTYARVAGEEHPSEAEVGHDGGYSSDDGTSHGAEGGTGHVPSFGSEERELTAAEEIAEVRVLLQHAGNPPPSSLVWELSQRLKRAAARRALVGGDEHDALTEECVRLRLLSKRLKKKQQAAPVPVSSTVGSS